MSAEVSELNLLLLRHGQTDSNAGGIIQGHLPIPLNDLGHRQAALLAKRLTTFTPRVGQLISSDLNRAMQSADPIAAALSLPIEQDSRWRERYLGEFQGKAIGERRTWTMASGEETPPGAETLGQFESRVRGALESIQASADASAVAVMTHGGPVRVILRMLADGRLPIEGDRYDEPPMIGNCAILHLRRTSHGEWAIRCVNDAAHLEEITRADAG